MKHWIKGICALLAAIVLLTATVALAEGGSMTVVNCENWVSLREAPNTSATRLAEVPLGAEVTGCEVDEGTGFTYCCYEGTWGYILSEYLSDGSADDAEAYDAEDEEEAGNLVFEETVNGYTVTARRTFEEGQEIMHISCVNPSLNISWTANTSPIEPGQMASTNAFMGGTAELPQIMLHVVQRGLYALDISDGHSLWILPTSTANLGSCSCAAVAEDGTMYLGGFLGPDPVAVDASGNVLWHSSVGRDDVYWLYDIQLEEDGLHCRYEWCTEEGEGTVIYDYEGNLVEVLPD